MTKAGRPLLSQLIRVVVAGAELFTGNRRLVMATVAGRIPASKFLQNMAVIYAVGHLSTGHHRRPGHPGHEMNCPFYFAEASGIK